jgi:hypothetical protein
MNEERFREIMENQDYDFECDDDNAVLGLLLIRKYIPKAGIEGASHDIIYSVGIEELIEAGITEEDVIQLRNWNWMLYYEESLACFV